MKCLDHVASLKKVVLGMLDLGSLEGLLIVSIANIVVAVIIGAVVIIEVAPWRRHKSFRFVSHHFVSMCCHFGFRFVSKNPRISGQTNSIKFFSVWIFGFVRIPVPDGCLFRRDLGELCWAKM